MDDKNLGFESRGTAGQMGSPVPDDSATVSQTGHDTDGRSPDYDERGDGARSGGATTAASLGDNTDGAGRDRTDRVTADETKTLITADKVIGTSVYNAAGERLGTVDSIMLGKYSGKVAFAVLSLGGVLGIGERFHPLPWEVLTYDEDKGGFNIDLPPGKLQSAPHFSREELNTLDYGARGGEIRGYYGKPGYES